MSQKNKIIRHILEVSFHGEERKTQIIIKTRNDWSWTVPSGGKAKGC